MKQRWIFGAMGAVIGMVSVAAATEESWGPGASFGAALPMAPPAMAAADLPGAELALAAHDAKPLTELAVANDMHLLVADRSPWPAASAVDERPFGAASAADFAGAGGRGGSYRLAGPTNSGFGDDAVAVALRQPVTTGSLPEPANWISMILGMALVTYSLRRRGRLPRVTS